MENSKNKTIKLGILGCGGHAFQSHAVPASMIDLYQLTAVYDTNEDAYLPFKSKFGESIEYCSSPEQLLASGIDALVIATPDEYHIDNLRMAIDAGLHVLIEKPLASNLGELTELRQLLFSASEKNLVLTSCHPRRFDPPFVWLKENTSRMIDVLGKVIGFDFDFSYHRPSAEWKHGRSLMLDHVNHEIDLLNFLYANASFSANLVYDSHDSYEVVGNRYGSDEKYDIAFRFRGTRRLEERKFLEWATVRHEWGQVHIDTEAGTAEILNHNTGIVDLETCGATDYPLRFKSVMDNFADTILGKQSNYLLREDLWVNNWMGVKLAEDYYCFWS